MDGCVAAGSGSQVKACAVDVHSRTAATQTRLVVVIVTATINDKTALQHNASSTKTHAIDVLSQDQHICLGNHGQAMLWTNIKKIYLCIYLSRQSETSIGRHKGSYCGSWQRQARRHWLRCCSVVVDCDPVCRLVRVCVFVWSELVVWYHTCFVSPSHQ